MAKVQTRRTISFNRNLYERIKEQSAADGISTANWVSKLITAELRKRGITVPSDWVRFGSGRLVIVKARVRRRTFRRAA